MKTHIVAICDSDAGFAQTLGAHLGQHGLKVMLFVTEAELLETTRSRKIDVVLLHVPLADGTSIVGALRESNPGIKIILIPDRCDMADVRHAMAVGVYDVLGRSCDVDMLAARVLDALQPGPPDRERCAAEIMIPIESYTCVQASATVRDGIERLHAASQNFFSSSLVMQSGHHAVLVFDESRLVGVLTMKNLIDALRPVYVPEGRELPQGMEFSPLFWSSLFSVRSHVLANRSVREIMNPRSPVVDAATNLMEVVRILCNAGRRRVAVERDGRIVGVIREQELFQEISRLILEEV